MGHVLVAIPPQMADEREERRNAARSSSSWMACCYTPRKQSIGTLATLSLPRYRVANFGKHGGMLDSDSDMDSCISDFDFRGLGGSKRVSFAKGALESTRHEWQEDSDDHAKARRSSDVDWANLSEKVESIQRIGLVNRIVSLPQPVNDGTKLRRRARLRRQSSFEKRKTQGLLGNTSALPSLAEESPVWTKKDLEIWNPDHIKAVTLQLFERHDADKKGRLSWQNHEVMNFVQDFFQTHGCLPPQMPPVIFSKAYNQVKVGSLPSHRDVDGLDMAETSEFVRRVYEFILSDVPVPETMSASIEPVAELLSLESLGEAPDDLSSPGSASSMMSPDAAEVAAPPTF